MPVHGAHSAKTGGFNDVAEAILAMLEEDPSQLREDYWQRERDGSVWPRLSKLKEKTGRRSVYHSFRVAGMVAAGLLPEDYIDG